MSGISVNEPEYPYAIMNRHYIIVSKDWGSKIIGKKAFERGLFKENAIVIDVNCRKFEVLDVLNLGTPWNPIYWFGKDPNIKVKYVYGEPVQLTFDAARKEIVDLICSRRWHGQTGGSEMHFRKTRALCKDMRDFLDGEYGISFYGKWVVHCLPNKGTRSNFPASK